MTITLFNRMYAHYKNAFDMELMLWRAGMTYAEAYAKSQQEQEWL